MLRRLKLGFDAGTDLLELQARIIMRSLEQVGVVLLGYVAAGVLVALGACTMLAAAAVLLANVVGAGFALLIVGGAVALVGLVILAFFYARSDSRTHMSRRELEQRAAAKQDELQMAIHGKLEPEREEPKPDLSHAVLNSLTRDPALIATACFAAVSFLGLKKSMRLLASATAVSRLIQSVHGNLHPNGQHADVSSDARSSARTGTPPSASRRPPTPPRTADGQWNERGVGTSPRR